MTGHANERPPAWIKIVIPDLPRIVLGTAQLGLTGSRADCFRLLDTYFDLGGRIIDTAAVYSAWVPGEARRSESIIGEWRSARAASRRPFVCTKGGHPKLSDMETPRLDQAALIDDVDGSLQALRVEQIDLFYLHRDDVTRPVEAILGPLAELVAAGKIAHVGLSNWTPGRVAVARASGVVPIASNQVLGNILCRRMGQSPDPSIVRLSRNEVEDARAHGTSLLLFSSQCGGMLGKAAGDPRIGEPYRTSAAQNAAEGVRNIAAQLNVDPTNLAVAFLLAFSPALFPIVGSRSVDQLKASMAARDVMIPPEAMAELTAIAGFEDW